MTLVLHSIKTAQRLRSHHFFSDRLMKRVKRKATKIHFQTFKVQLFKKKNSKMNTEEFLDGDSAWHIRPWDSVVPVWQFTNDSNGLRKCQKITKDIFGHNDGS